MSDFLNAYSALAAEITQNIKAATNELAPTFKNADPLKAELVRFIAQGGKRFRPVLSLAVARAYGHNEVFPHLALELFHKYLLTHDDIIDRDERRYGAPTIHAKMRRLRQDQHFGNSLAIIGGDLLAGASTKIILKSNLPAKTKIALQDAVNIALDEVAWGWYDQFLMDYLPLGSPKINFKRIETSIIWVTGKYSIKLPLVFGFRVAGKALPPRLEYFADKLGALFQTGDDMIGLLGDPVSTGKSNIRDIVQGKKTLPMWFAYQKASAADKKTLASLVGNANLTTDEGAQVREIFIRCGAQEKTKQLMQKYRQECLRELQPLRLPAELKQFLQSLVFYLETRDR